jgi:hypothetical protein
MIANFVAVALGASLPVALGIVSFAYQQRWARRDTQRRAREDRVVGYLTNAYTSLCAIMPAGGVGYLIIEEKQNLEAAFRDAFLYGNDEVVSALEAFMNEFLNKRQDTSIDELLVALRSQLRSMMSLGDADQDKAKKAPATTPWIMTGWRYDALTSTASGIPSVELLTSNEASAITGLAVDELLKYAAAGTVPRPIVVDGSPRWIASAIRGLAEKLTNGPAD